MKAEQQRRSEMNQLVKQFDNSLLKIRGHINDYAFKIRFENWRYEIAVGRRSQ